MRNKFFDVKCPNCFIPLKANNVLFKKRNANGDIMFYDPAFIETNELVIRKEYLEGVKCDDITPITDRCCPYCLKSLPEQFGLAETKYISLICLNGRHEKYIEAVKKRLENHLEWKGSFEIKNSLFFKYKKRKKDYHIAIYGLANDSLLYSDPNIRNKERRRLDNADGIIFIIDSVSNKIFTDILNSCGERMKKVPVAFIFNDFDKLHKEAFESRTDNALEPIATEGKIDIEDVGILSDRLKTILIDSFEEDKFIFQKAENVFGENNKVFHLMTNKIEGAETPILWLLSELKIL